MARVKNTTTDSTRKPMRPALTPEARENQLISLAIDLVEQRLIDGTASAQETTHFLKLASRKAKLEAENANKQMKEDSEKLKNSILNDSKVFGDLQIDTTTRRKVLDNISKPVYKDPNTGKLLTAIQKYEAENKLDFIKNVGLLYTLTDGFKNLDSLVNSKVKKETKKAMRELENTINNTSRYSDGNLKFVSGVSDDNESYIGKGFSLDI